MTQRVKEHASFTLDDLSSILRSTWRKGKTDSTELSFDIQQGTHKIN